MVKAGMAMADDERRTTRVRRRLLTIPAYALALVALVPLLPLLVPLVALLDVLRGARLAGVRLLVFAVVFLAAEMAGLAASVVAGVVTLGDRERSIAWQRALQTAWARGLFVAARTLFGFRVVVEGEDAVPHGPVVVLVRHASLADTLLPTVLLTHRHGLRLRFVLKRELLWDPCLDVVGHHLPNAFVARGAIDGAREIARVRALATDVGPGEGVLLYPEGTRWTPAKQARAMAKLAASDPERHARLSSLARVLPTQLGGTLAVIDAMPDADVLFMAHTGFEGAATVRDVLSGALVGRTIRVGFWRVPATAIPSAAAARVRWLDAEWLRMDGWVATASDVPAPGLRARAMRPAW
jgi:1-acyl-sn-glycerol-3-phosphate acyltransferase